MLIPKVTNLPHKEENKLSETRKQISTFFKSFEVHSVEMNKICIGVTESYLQVPAQTNPNT